MTRYLLSLAYGNAGEIQPANSSKPARSLPPNPQLRQLKVPRRSESLREDELSHSPASQYPATRTWAKLLHDHIPGVDGLAWRPRLASDGEAYLFFGDRCGAGDFAVVAAPTPLTSPTEYGRIKAVADSANITINYSK